MIFDIIKKELKAIVSDLEFDRYIKNLSYSERRSSSDLCVIEVNNSLLLSWIRTKYSSKIADLFEEHTKIRPKVEIIIARNAKKGFKDKKAVLEQKFKSTKLNPSYTFDSFVVGPSNQFAYSIAKTVSQDIAYNPVVIYGGVGLGKTHLLQAIGNAYDQNKIIIYLTAEHFLNEFIYNIQHKTMDRFREKYRKCDLLLIDDIQFLSNKEETQQEFFHTFEELHKNEKQIILTSDKIPKQIAGLEERLKSRFQWGQVVDIQKPELETKIAIIKKKCKIDQVFLDNEIVEFIAKYIDENIREIEGIIIKLHSYSKMIGKDIDLELTKQILRDHIKEKKENITIEEIIKITSNELGVKQSEILSKSRVNKIVIARRIIFYISRELTHNSMPTIAKHFKMKDHSAVSKALKKIEEMIDEDANFKNKVHLLINKISSKDVN